MIISDLNYLESANEVAVEGGFGLGKDYSNIYFKEKFEVDKKFKSDVYVKGHIATAESDAKAYGYGTATQIFTNTVTTPYSSQSNGVSISASS